MADEGPAMATVVPLTSKAEITHIPMVLFTWHAPFTAASTGGLATTRTFPAPR
jgi:hypothetical protein